MFPPKRSFLNELNPWSGIDHQANLLTLFLRPWPLIVYPAIILGFLGYSATLGWYLVVSNTFASIFQAPPFNFSPSISGLINISGLIGTVLGAYAGGALTDKVVEWKARKNNGIYEPEFRLLTLIIPFFVLPFGLLMYSLKWLPLTFRYGIGVERQAHWIVPYIGFGGIHLGFAAVNAITMAYSTFAFFCHVTFSYRCVLSSCLRGFVACRRSETVFFIRLLICRHSMAYEGRIPKGVRDHGRH